MLTRTLRQDDVDKIAEADDVRKSYFHRDPDRPDGRFVKQRARVSPEVRRAQGRLRTDRWRSDMDRRKAPTAEQIGMAMVVAMATSSNLRGLTRAELDLFERAFHDLKARGFDIKEAVRTMRRLRNRLVDPADRDGEPTESSVAFAAVGEPELPF